MTKLDALLSPVIFRGDYDSFIISNWYPAPQCLPQKSVEQVTNFSDNSIKFQNPARFINKGELINNYSYCSHSSVHKVFGTGIWNFCGVWGLDILVPASPRHSLCCTILWANIHRNSASRVHKSEILSESTKCSILWENHEGFLPLQSWDIALLPVALVYPPITMTILHDA